MLDDRSYMRETSDPSGRWLTGTWIILIANISCFLLMEIYRVAATRVGQDEFLAMSPFALSLAGLRAGKIWQLLTFQFLHSGVIHLVFNSLGIFFFGREMEETLGRKRFYALYFLSGTLGGLLNVAGSILLPNLIGRAAVVGASAGVSGLIGAFATMFPLRKLTLFVYAIIPVKMNARTLLAVLAGLALFGLFVQKDNIAHLAHLGGMLGGVGFIVAMQRGVGFPSFAALKAPAPQARPRQLVATAAPEAKVWSKVPPAEDLSSEEYMSREVDPILDKISAHGMESLTDRERRILEAARRRMSDR